MTDLVASLPPGSRPEREYIVGTVLRSWLGLDVDFEDGHPGVVSLRVPGMDSRRIAVPDRVLGSTDGGWQIAKATPTRREDIRTEVLLPSGEARTLQMPRLFDVGPQTRQDEDTLIHDVFGIAFFLLAGCEDYLSHRRDAYGRQPFAGSLLDAMGLVEYPIVDYLVDYLWLELKRRFPSLERRFLAYEVCVTHDVDYLLSWSAMTTRRALRGAVGDLAKRRDPALAVRRTVSRLTRPKPLSGKDPFDTYDFLMTASERVGVPSHFYFLLGGPTSLDHTNDVNSPAAQHLLRRIRERGHHVGLHGSAAFDGSPATLAGHLATLTSSLAAAGAAEETWGGRQHYLTWRSPQTWRTWNDAGLDYDSSVAFIERVGFRAGTCRAYRTFDLERRQSLNLEERPLVIHDSTLWGDMGLFGEGGLSLGRTIAERCRDVGGTLTLLWHNSSVISKATRQGYLDLLQEVSR